MSVNKLFRHPVKINNATNQSIFLFFTSRHVPNKKEEIQHSTQQITTETHSDTKIISLMKLPLSSSSSATTIPVDSLLSLFNTHAKAEMIQKPLAVLRHDLYN